MTKNELWEKIVEQNPRFRDGGSAGCRLTCNGIEKLFDLVWSVAHDKGVNNGRALESMANKEKETGESDIMDMFTSIFSKK